VNRPALHDRLFLIALLTALPSLVVALVLLDRGVSGPLWLWLASAALVVSVLAGAVLLRHRLVYQLRIAANLVTALRQGDLSIRARRGRRDGAYGSLVVELNTLAEALRDQRLDEMEAVALLRNILGEIDVAVFAFDDARRLRMLNGAGERLLGKTAATAMGREAGELGLSDCLTGEPERTLSLDLPGGAGRWELRRGGYRHLGRSRRLVVLSDVSRALRAEELAAWKRLIRVMSHELNNSLAPIRSLAGSLDRLIEREPPPEGWRDDLRTGLRVIASRAEALNRFVGAYASLAKLPEPRPEPVAVEPLVRRVAELESRLPVAVEAGPGVTVRADRDQLEQLLINLVKNAVDASLETGGAVQVAWEVTGDRLLLRVRDEGPGLSETANLFVPFYSTRPEGTGVGLVLCRQIAEAHGGSIVLQNRDDAAGCEARVILPLRPSLEA
jgi:nitrogen fixation/metabolism regulation signal transduction histidine kinase